LHDGPIPIVRVNLLLAPLCERMRAARCQPQPVLSSQPHHLAPDPQNLLSRLPNIAADPRANLDHRLVHLRLYPLRQDRPALLQDLRVNVRPEIARFRIDGLVFLFDPDTEAWARCHAIPPAAGRAWQASRADLARARSPSRPQHLQSTQSSPARPIPPR